MCVNQRLITNPYTKRQLYVNCGKCPACLQEKAIHRVRRIKNTETDALDCMMVSLTYTRGTAPYIDRSEAYNFAHARLPYLNVYRDSSFRRVRVDKGYDFEYYEKDKLCSRVHVDYSSGVVTVENFTDDIVAQAFGRQKVTIDSIDSFFRDRVFDETNVGKHKLLELLGLKHFDAEAIARKTHGMLVHDMFWVRFDNEDLTYEDIKKLKGWK